MGKSIFLDSSGIKLKSWMYDMILWSKCFAIEVLVYNLLILVICSSYNCVLFICDTTYKNKLNKMILRVTNSTISSFCQYQTRNNCRIPCHYFNSINELQR